MAEHDAADGGPVQAPDCELAGARPALTAPGRWSFCHLPFAYQLVIWAARTWKREAETPARRWATVRQAFANVNAADAAVPFLRLMQVVQTGARKAVLIGEGGCTVFADEMRFAEIVACAARGDSAGAACRLRALLAPSAARIARALADDVATELTRAGLRFSRSGTVAEPVAPPPGAMVH